MNTIQGFPSFDKLRFLSRVFQVTVALWFLRMVLPGVKYVFIPSMVLLGITSLWALRSNLFKKEYAFEFLKTFNPLIFLGVFYVVGIILSDSYYNKPLRDMAEYLINFYFLTIFFALTYYSRGEEGFFWVFKRMSRVIWITSIMVAIIGLAKHVLQLSGVQLPIETPYGTSINIDKNFYALYSFIGLIGLYPRVAQSTSFKERASANVLVLLLLLNIAFSYSPRSILLLTLFTLLLLVMQVITIFRLKESSTANWVKNMRFISILLVLGLFFAFLSVHYNNTFSERVLNHYFKNTLIVNDNAIRSSIDNIYQFERWGYAMEYYKEFSWSEKIFGSGFDYLKSFDEVFNNGLKGEDYPHNPILSSLLYSGLLGAIFTLFFLAIALYYSLIYFKRHPLFSLMLLVCSLFVFVSGNSLFSVPIFLFLFSLSFLVRHQEISELKDVPNLVKPGSQFIKEIFDYFLASIALVVLSPLLFIVTLVVGFTMGWPVVFTQVRIGQNGKPFNLHKFRSMKKTKSNTTVAAEEQNRVTWFGKFMRRYKLDELPELWNIIRGDMSFVGPRPDVPGYADILQGEDRIILALKPGLTGAASLKYMHEEDLLSKVSNPQEHNDNVIFPDKVEVNKKYMNKWTLWLDLKIIGLTALRKSMHEDKFI